MKLLDKTTGVIISFPVSRVDPVTGDVPTYWQWLDGKVRELEDAGLVERIADTEGS